MTSSFDAYVDADRRGWLDPAARILAQQAEPGAVAAIAGALVGAALAVGGLTLGFLNVARRRNAGLIPVSYGIRGQSWRGRLWLHWKPKDQLARRRLHIDLLPGLVDTFDEVVTERGLQRERGRFAGWLHETIVEVRPPVEDGTIGGEYLGYRGRVKGIWVLSQPEPDGLIVHEWWHAFEHATLGVTTGAEYWRMVKESGSHFLHRDASEIQEEIRRRHALTSVRTT